MQDSIERIDELGPRWDDGIKHDPRDGRNQRDFEYVALFGGSLHQLASLV